MKRRISILLCLTIMAVSCLWANNSEAPIRKNTLKTNSLSIILGTGTCFYERTVSDWAAWQLGINYFNYGFTGLDLSGLMLTPEFRIYPHKNAGNGFYIAPYLRFQNFSIGNSENDNRNSLRNIGGGAVAGRQWQYPSGFTIDLFFGTHIAKAIVVEEYDGQTITDVLFNSVGNRVGLAFGFSF